MQKLSQKLQNLQDKQRQCQKNKERWAQRNEQLSVEMEKAQAEMVDNGHRNQAESLFEAELDMEIRGLKEEGAAKASQLLAQFSHVRSRLGQTAA